MPEIVAVYMRNENAITISVVDIVSCLVKMIFFDGKLMWYWCSSGGKMIETCQKYIRKMSCILRKKSFWTFH